MTHSAETVHAVHHNTKHGRFGTKIYQTWTSMLDRCRNPRHQAWHNYGGRGITVDPRWARSFSEFLVDMGEKPEGMTLDRIDPNGGYTKGNCRWATWREQSLNKRNTRRYEAFGQKKTAKEWAEDPRCRVSESTIKHRMKTGGWQMEEALLRPSDHAQLERKGLAIAAFGETKSAWGWSNDHRAKCSDRVIRKRVNNGWTSELAISTPAMTNRESGIASAIARRR